MARKAKLSTGKHSRFVNSKPMTRSVGNRLVRKRYLIVCEGTKTEPNYFKSFVKILPRGSVQLDVVGEGFNTLSLVEDAERRSNESAKRNIPYDRVWVVFAKQQAAVRNASRLLETHNGLSPSNSNPATTVHKLVQELLTLQHIR